MRTRRREVERVTVEIRNIVYWAVIALCEVDSFGSVILLSLGCARYMNSNFSALR